MRTLCPTLENACAALIAPSVELSGNGHFVARTYLGSVPAEPPKEEYHPRMFQAMTETFSQQFRNFSSERGDVVCARHPER